MSSQPLVSNLPKASNLLTWSLISLSTISCCSRPDYNIIIGFLILFIRGLNAGEKKIIISRLQIQFLVISFIFDILWIIKYNSVWTHGEENSDLWNSLSVIHNLAFYLGILEFLVKIPLCLFLYKDFSESQGAVKDLFNFDYKPSKAINI